MAHHQSSEPAMQAQLPERSVLEAPVAQLQVR
jgi:hypothetical protein